MCMTLYQRNANVVHKGIIAIFFKDQVIKVRDCFLIRRTCLTCGSMLTFLDLINFQYIL
mgnify:CR=1 FL=1